MPVRKRFKSRRFEHCLKPIRKGLDQRVRFREMHRRFHSRSIPNFLHIPEADVLLDCRTELGEALKDGRQVAMVLCWIVPPNVNVVNEKRTLVEFVNSEEDFGECRFACGDENAVDVSRRVREPEHGEISLPEPL